MSKGSKNDIKNRIKGQEFFYNGIKVVPVVMMTANGKMTVMENHATQEVIMDGNSPLPWSHASTVQAG